MEPIGLEEVLNWTGGTLIKFNGAREIIFKQISTDSRKDCRNSLFIALKGKNFDGHRFVSDAVKSAALAAMVEEPLPDNIPQIIVKNSIKALGDLAKNYKRKFCCVFIGITGSDGKTTTKEMSAHLLASMFNVCSNQGNFNNEIGLPLSIFNISKKTEIGIFELGMNGPGQLRYLGNVLQPDIAVITSIGYAHLGFFNNRAALAHAKAEILENLSIDGFGIFNRDNDFQNILKQKGVFLKTVGFGPLCNFRGFITSYNTDSFNLQVNGWENVNFRINSWNGAIAYPALFSLFIAEYFGIPKSHLPSLVNNFVLINGRGKIRIVDGVKIFDESYNANPGSLKTALRYFALQKAKRKIVVIGAMGELGKWSRFYHKKLGDMIQKLDFDFVFTIGEDACIISKLVKKKGMHFDNLQEMTEYISGFVKAGDAVLVKGSRMNNLDLLVEHLVEKTGIK